MNLSIHKNTSKTYSYYLIFLLIFFSYRVAAQLLQFLYPIDILPNFEAWHSGIMPYSVLLTAQILIITSCGIIIYHFKRGTVIPHLKLGQCALLFGALYALVMLCRLIIGLFFMVDHSWFGATLPTVFHLVLASSILIYGYYHYKYGKKKL